MKAIPHLRAMSLCAAAIVGCTRPAIGAAVELLPNGSFEEGTGNGAAGWSMPTRWRAAKNAGMNGSRGIAFENADDRSYYKFPSASVPLEAGKRYEYSVWAKTDGLDGGRVNVCVEWYDADGNWMSGSYQAGPGGTHDWTRFSGATPPIPSDARSARVAFFVSKGALGRAWFDDVSVRPLERPAFGGLYSSAYRNLAANGKVKFHAAVNFAANPRAKALFTYHAQDGRLRRVPATTATADAAVLEIDVSRLEVGTHPVSCELVAADGTSLGKGSLDFTRMEELPSRRVWIDGKRRAIVDGKPFFPLGMYMADVNTNSFATFLTGPFNCIMPYNEPGFAQLDFCRARGVEVIYPLNSVWSWHRQRPGDVDTDAEADAYVERVVNAKKNHPAILAWYCNDEISLERFPQLLARQRLLERIDQGHPTWTVLYQFGEVRGYYPTFDVVGTDPYPVPDSPIGNVAMWTRTTNEEAMGLKPMWQVPQAFAWEDFGKKGRRHPTREEMVNMTWQCVANGANGIVYFTYRLLYKDGKFQVDRWADICAAAAGVKPYIPVILSDEEPPVVTGATEELSVRAWRYQGNIYLALANNTRDHVSGEVGIDSKYRELSVLQGAKGCLQRDSHTIAVALAGLETSFIRLSP